jgi:hypothetical protein
VGHLLRVRLNEPGQHDLEHPTSISFCLFVKNIFHNSAIKYERVETAEELGDLRRF